MNGETNENLDELNVENAFSDLISQYFEEESNTQNAGNINAGPVLDWDSVANGQLYTNLAEGVTENLDNQINNAGTIGNNGEILNAGNVGNNNGILYNNLGTINGEGNQTQELGNGNSGLYTNLGTVGEGNLPIEEQITDNGNANNDNEQTQNATNILYNEIGELNKKKLIENAYNAVTMSGKLVQEVNAGQKLGLNEANTINQGNANGTDFKLTQANLPAKIGFWTKVRNFFITDSKIQYSVQTAEENTGLWNKVQNFFSFGKNK